MIDEDVEALQLRLEVIRAHASCPWLVVRGWWRCAALDCSRDADLPDGWGPMLLRERS